MKVFTPNGGYAELVQKSKCSVTGKEILTVSVKYGLIVHAEFLRHRLLSRGVKSNRAIPAKKIREEVLNDPYVPIWFGANQSGMVAKAEVKHPKLAKALWLGARYPAVFCHWLGEKALGGHKEWLNRLLNPWQWVRETITATEWDNLYNLRIHEAAQQDIKVIVEAIYKVDKGTEGLPLKSGEYHVPYVQRKRNHGELEYYDGKGVTRKLTIEQAIKASAARCARSSYDNHDKTKANYETDLKLYNRLIEDDPKHSSPVEHQGTPMKHGTSLENSTAYLSANIDQDTQTWEKGITHEDRMGSFWSGNFKGWIQHRQTLDSHTCWEYTANTQVKQ